MHQKNMPEELKMIRDDARKQITEILDKNYSLNTFQKGIKFNDLVHAFIRGGIVGILAMVIVLMSLFGGM